MSDCGGGDSGDCGDSSFSAFNIGGGIGGSSIENTHSQNIGSNWHKNEHPLHPLHPMIVFLIFLLFLILAGKYNTLKCMNKHL